jgi:hypothetical protein
MHAQGVAASAVLLMLAGTAYGQMASHSITRIDALKALGLTGNGVRIGQVEDAVPAGHLSFVDRSFTDGNATTNTHATRVAGIMAGTNTTTGGVNVGGIARRATVWSSFSGGGGATYATALDWQATAPVTHVVNISWGGPPSGDPDPDTTMTDWLVNQRRILVVKSAGNRGNQAGHAITSPGDGFNMLTVGATGWEATTNYRRLASYSSYGPTTGTVMGGRAKPDLVAPGTAILSPIQSASLTQYNSADSGTSFSAPHVTGAAALLIEHSTGQTWEAPGRDPRSLRAVLMNGATKNVYDRANHRWDTAGGTKATNNLDVQTGTGLLDAERSFQMYREGRVPYDFKTGPIYGVEAPTPNAGWSLESVGNGHVTQWWPDDPIRKGTYVTSTLAWEREVTGANAGAAAYGAALRNLDLTVRRFDNDAVIGSSTSTVDSTEHVVAKMPVRERVKIEAKSVAGGGETFGIAWHSYAAPTTLRCFNGDFMGDRGALNDNGWYDVSTHGVAGVGKPAFTDQLLDESFAMKLTPESLGLTSGLAQEVLRPTSGFWLRFDVAFTGVLNEAALSVMLGDVNVLSAAGFENGLITPIAANTNQYRTYTVDLAYNRNVFAGLTGTHFDLAFLGTGYGGGNIYIDNICYIPTTGSLGVLGVFGLLAGRRRRA